MPRALIRLTGAHLFASNREAYTRHLSKVEQGLLDDDASYFMDLYVMDSDGSNVKQLTFSPGYDGGPFYNAEGTKILWRRFNPDGNSAEIWTMDADGSNQRQLTANGMVNWGPFYHPSGDYIIYSSNVLGHANFELFMIDPEGTSDPIRVTNTDGTDILPVFSPDGERLAWSTTRTRAVLPRYIWRTGITSWLCNYWVCNSFIRQPLCFSDLVQLFSGLGLCWVAQAQSPSLNELGSPLSTPDLLHHSLSIDLDPVRESIVVSDRMRLPQAWLGQNLHFELNSGLSISASNLPVSEEPNAQVASVDVIDSTVAQEAEVKRYLISVPASFIGELEINYSGTINDLAEQSSPEYSQSFAQSSGIISGEGVFLSRASVWVPLFDNALITFDLSAQFAPSASTWTTISQGQSAGLNGWRTQYPQEEIYLIAAEFTHYSESTGRVLASAYLRNPDPNLATKYLDATARYLKLYEPLLGDYPFSNFALVENFWETGFGMPSFTLLGPRVIRFPFILESSYPHELLHNWWGNGVYPDYETGNWSEGLTAYLADHLFREMDGSGHEYRKEMLARYKNYVSEGEDFPLSQFTSRNSATTQAVGYGKALMLWHMLRIELGDELFIDGLRQFYDRYQFQRASFADIENLFSELSGRDLSDFFSQWVNRTGAPQLEVAVEELNGNRARIMFAQTQFEEPYSLKVPVALFYEGESDPQIYFVSLTQKTEGVIAEEFDRLQSVLVDPFFDVFRSLDIEETPPTVGELFGADEIAFVLPLENKLEWSRLAESFAEGADFELIDAETLEQLPSNRSVWVLGNDNPFVPAVSSALDAFGVAWEPNEIRLADSEVPFENRSTVLVGRHPENPDLALGWIHIDELVAMSGLIEKLPHYGKYSYLSFTGEEPTNDVKGIWASATHRCGG